MESNEVNRSINSLGGNIIETSKDIKSKEIVDAEI